MSLDHTATLLYPGCRLGSSSRATKSLALVHGFQMCSRATRTGEDPNCNPDPLAPQFLGIADASTSSCKTPKPQFRNLKLAPLTPLYINL